MNKHIKDLIRQKNLPQLKRRAKNFALAGLALFFIAGGLVIWASVSALGYLSAKAGHLVSSTNTQETISQLQTQIKTIPTIDTIGCWDQAQGLMAVRPWLEKPLIVNLEDLKVACLGAEQKPVKESGPVDQSEKNLKRADG